MIIILLVISTLISAAATTLIAVGGLSSPQQRTSTQGKAAEISKITQEQELPTPTRRVTLSPTPTPLPSPTATPTPIKVVISPYLTATTSANKKSFFITFNNLSNTKSILYKVNYSADGGQKSAQGNVAVQDSQEKNTKEIILGVCSGSDCSYDTNVKNIKIEATFTLTDNTTSQITYPYAL